MSNIQSIMMEINVLCVRYSELADVENFVEKFGIETLSARDKHGYTPAHWVALDGNVDMMRYLVERNAPVDLRCLGTQGPRPIHWACRKGHAGKLIQWHSILIDIKSMFKANFFHTLSCCSSSAAMWCRC